MHGWKVPQIPPQDTVVYGEPLMAALVAQALSALTFPEPIRSNPKLRAETCAHRYTPATPRRNTPKSLHRVARKIFSRAGATLAFTVSKLPIVNPEILTLRELHVSVVKPSHRKAYGSLPEGSRKVYGRSQKATEGLGR
jgi:hypothetical protein